MNNGSASPRRPALGLSLSVMNRNDFVLPSLKRKGFDTGEDDGDVRHRTCDQQLGQVMDDCTASVLLPGCGRVICKTCCMESVMK